MLFLPLQKFTEATKRCENSASTFSMRVRIVSFKTPPIKRQHMAFHRQDKPASFLSLLHRGCNWRLCWHQLWRAVKTKLSRETSFKKTSCHCHNKGPGAQTRACATLGLCDLRGTLRQCDHLCPYSKTIFRTSTAQERFRGTDDERTVKSREQIIVSFVHSHMCHGQNIASLQWVWLNPIQLIPINPITSGLMTIPSYGTKTMFWPWHPSHQCLHGMGNALGKAFGFGVTGGVNLLLDDEISESARSWDAGGWRSNMHMYAMKLVIIFIFCIIQYIYK